MVRSKPGHSKKPQRGFDFKKIKRKIGRKLPPPRNFTDTQIKSKAIVLPEQSVASERAGIAVNKKGLTLRELLQQTAHYNAKIRKAALAGIKDLILKHPSELRVHKLAVLDKLRERIGDVDKNVRETLYQLLECDIFPGLKEDISPPILLSLMNSVFSTMNHTVLDIKIMAFKFFNLIVQIFPSSFTLYAEKVLRNYTYLLQGTKIHLQDSGKLNNVLDGLIHCMSLLVSRKGENQPSNESNIVDQRRLHAFKTVIHRDDTGINSAVKELEDLVPILVNCFRESTSLIHAGPIFDAQSFDCMLKTIQCIHLVVNIFVNETQFPSVSSRLPFTSLSHGPKGRNTMFTHLSRLWESFPIGKLHSSTEKEDERYFTLNVRIIGIFLHLADWIDGGGITIEKFLEFIESSLESLQTRQVGSYLPSNNVLLEKHFSPIVLFIPRLVSQVTDKWKARLLEAFTGAYIHSKVESKLCLAYLSAVEEMLLPVKSDSDMSITSSYTDMLDYQVAWIQHLPNILLQLGDKDPSVSKVVLKLILRIGQCCHQNSAVALEYDNLQVSLKGFYCDEGVMHYGSFMKLPRDCQELAVCSLYYISSLSSDLLQSLSSSCLSDNMEPFMLLRIIDVLHSAYKAGHVHISDHMGFLVTVVAHKVFPERFCIMESNGKVLSRRIFKSLSAAVCTCLSQMGDSSFVLKLLCKNIFNEMSKKPSVDNMYGLLRMIVSLDTRPTKLSQENIGNLSNWLFVYLIEISSYITEQIGAAFHSDQIHMFRYYIQPCIFLFSGSDVLLYHVLKMLDSLIMDNLLVFEYALKPFDRLRVTCSVLVFMDNDERLHRSLFLCKSVVKSVLQNVLSILESSKHALTLEEKHNIQTLFHQLNSKACRVQCSDACSFE